MGEDQIIGRVPLSRAMHRLAHLSPAVRYALKFGTTMAAALWFAYSSELSDKVTIFITVLFVMQPTSGGSIRKGLPRIAGTVACALMCVLIYVMFVQLPPLFLASWCAVIAVGSRSSGRSLTSVVQSYSPSRRGSSTHPFGHTEIPPQSQRLGILLLRSTSR